MTLDDFDEARAMDHKLYRRILNGDIKVKGRKKGENAIIILISQTQGTVGLVNKSGNVEEAEI